MITLKTLQEKVEKHISEYVEFDIKEIFEVADYISIYGGAVRDSLAGMEIHDVDILCMPNSAVKLKEYLEEKHNYEMVDLCKRGSLEMYKDISVIAEPWTLMNDKKRIIQLIILRYPDGYYYKKHNRITYSNAYQKAYYNLIRNVDISSCGVFLEGNNGSIKLMEACVDGIAHCLTKRYLINHWAILYESNRTIMREHKLNSRGWKNILRNDDVLPWNNNGNEKLKNERVVKLKKLEFEEPEYDYIIWSKEHIQSMKNKKSENDICFDL